MLTAESIVGKVVSFIAGKTIGKLVGLPFDKRRKACRSLTKLYYCDQALDDVTQNFIQALDSFHEYSNAFAVVNALNTNAKKVELATNMFVDLGYELYDGLEIIDPALAECCHTLYNWKVDFLSFMSNAIHWDRSTSPPKIVVKRPIGKMESVDMDSMYNAVDLRIGKGYNQA
jgi:hypothetical protein